MEITENNKGLETVWVDMCFLCKTFFRSEFPGISLRIILLQVDKRNSLKKKCMQCFDGLLEEHKKEQRKFKEYKQKCV
jgi:hypothetical protein